jgi:hypothetical protein
MRHTTWIKQETLVLLEILALGKRQVAQGKVIPVAEAFRRARARIARRGLPAPSR